MMDSLLAQNGVLDTVCNRGTTPLMQAGAGGNLPVVSTQASSRLPRIHSHALTPSEDGGREGKRERGRDREREREECIGIGGGVVIGVYRHSGRSVAA